MQYNALYFNAFHGLEAQNVNRRRQIFIVRWSYLVRDVIHSGIQTRLTALNHSWRTTVDDLSQNLPSNDTRIRCNISFCSFVNDTMVARGQQNNFFS